MATPMFSTRMTQLDDLLGLICEDLQISPTMHRSAEECYLAIGQWLEAEGSPIRLLRPRIYPQGSFRIGTTTRPLRGEEYDLDLVLELDLGTRTISPLAILDLVEKRLHDHGSYRRMVERKKRCVRLTYAREFHLDILPARPDALQGGTRVQIPDRELHAWLASDPRGYASWFKARASSGLLTLTRKVEPVPDHEEAEEKTALQQVVQLLKRARDVAYEEEPDDAPRSIVLTTLAGRAFDGSVSLTDALLAVVQGILQATSRTSTALLVTNPVQPAEVLSEQWLRDPTTYARFTLWMRSLASSLETMVGASLAASVDAMSGLFGDPATHAALERQASRAEEARSRGALRVARSDGRLTVGASSAALIRGNTFFGDA